MDVIPPIEMRTMTVAEIATAVRKEKYSLEQAVSEFKRRQRSGLTIDNTPETPEAA
jgi:hypothetical protein